MCNGLVASRYDDAADAYDKGLEVAPDDEALVRGRDSVMKAQTAATGLYGVPSMSLAWVQAAKTRAVIDWSRQ